MDYSDLYTSRAGRSMGGVADEVAQEKDMESVVKPKLAKPAAEALRYFSVCCRGQEMSEFWKDDGGPDIRAAREHAEKLREQFSRLKLLDTYLAVEQRVNKVIVTVDHKAVNRLGDWS